MVATIARCPITNEIVFGFKQVTDRTAFLGMEWMIFHGDFFQRLFL